MAGTPTNVGFALVRVMVHPAAGAGPPRVRVPVDEPPACTDGGFSAMLCNAYVPTVNVALKLLAPNVAVIWSVNDTWYIWGVETVNVLLVEPAGTVTDAGTVT